MPVFSLGAPLVGDKRQERELVFELARRAAHLRPERFVRFILPQPQQLGHIIDAAMALGEAPADKAPTADVDGELGKTVQAMRRALTPVQLEQVASIGRKLQADGARAGGGGAHVAAGDRSDGVRAGFVMTGDLETSARLIAGRAAAGDRAAGDAAAARSGLVVSDRGAVRRSQTPRHDVRSPLLRLAYEGGLR